MNKSKEVFQAIVGGDKDKINDSIINAIDQRLQSELDVRKVRVTANIFNKNQVEESTDLGEEVSPEEFVKGGNTKVRQSDVETVLGPVYDDEKLTKLLIKTKAYKQGEDDADGRNPYKKDTADFHLFILGQQIAQSRQ